jgi:hypothetical protein
MGSLKNVTQERTSTQAGSNQFIITDYNPNGPVADQSNGKDEKQKVEQQSEAAQDNKEEDNDAKEGEHKDSEQQFIVAEYTIPPPR